MKIALIGYGRMGRIIEQVARAQGHTIAAIVDPFIDPTIDPFAANPPEGIPVSKTIAEANLNDADAAIEFTVPATACENIIALAQRKIPTVTGTTGWYDKLDEARKAVETADSALLWSSNFSIGVNLFYRIAWHAAELFNNFIEYDIGGFEAHHNKKQDSPSGTAKTLAEGVLSKIDRKKKIVWDTLTRKPEADELHFPSLRIGAVPGTHSLFFDSQADTIEITHTARNREGFALGAVLAAQWLTAKERHGVFTMDYMLKEYV
jgi:4-hydroxy-tetrahydrodipicolinate reductase